MKEHFIQNEYPDQIVFRPTEQMETEQHDSESEQQGSKQLESDQEESVTASTSGSEDEPEEKDNEEPEEIENKDKDVKSNDNDNSISYSSAITIMDWGLQAHPDYHKDYCIGDSGASSHMVGDAKNLFAKTLIQGKVNSENGTSIPIVWKGKMNEEVVPKQGQLSKRVSTMKVTDGMMHKLFNFTTAPLHNWKMYGTRKENSDIKIKLTSKLFEPIVFDRVLRFDDAVLVAAKIKMLPSNANQEEAHTAMLEG